MAERAVAERLRMSENHSYPALADCRTVKYFHKDARQFLAAKENTALLNAGALLIDNALQKVLGNFFIFINKPGVPIQLFTNQDQAMAWLQPFKKSQLEVKSH